jgi:isoleucyl-tRNA synthetase
MELMEGEYELVLESADPANAVSFLDTHGFVVLDTATTPELEAEGLANDFIRDVQQTRRTLGFDVSDRISMTVTAEPALALAIKQNEEKICAATLTTTLAFVEWSGGPLSAEEWDERVMDADNGTSVGIKLERV